MVTSTPKATKRNSLDEDTIHESLLKFREYDLDRSSHHSLDFTTTSVVDKFKVAAKSASDYKKGETATIRKVLDEIELVSVKRMSEGFNEFNFSVGVFNCVSTTVSFG